MRKFFCTLVLATAGISLLAQAAHAEQRHVMMRSDGKIGILTANLNEKGVLPCKKQHLWGTNLGGYRQVCGAVTYSNANSITIKKNGVVHIGYDRSKPRVFVAITAVNLNGMRGVSQTEADKNRLVREGLKVANGK